jgi:dTDP-4-dehydrorhamnose reductase
MRILVIGVGGLLGSNLAATAVQQSWEVLGAWHTVPSQVPGASTIGIDTADREACVSAARRFEPDAIVHAGTVGDPGRFEREPELQRRTVLGVEHTLAAARSVHAHYVLVSCDWVFSGLRPPGERWEETDPTEPVNAYGRAQLAAEELVRGESGIAWLIARVGDPYGVNASRPIERRDPTSGHGGRAHGERRKLANDRHAAVFRHVWLRSGEALGLVLGLREGHPLPAPTDVHRSPTYAWDWGQRLCELIAQERDGVYHTAGPDSVHRYEYAQMIARTFGCDPEHVVHGDIAAHLDALGEPRELVLGPNVSLDARRASAALGHPAVDVEAGLWLMSDQLRRALAR